MRITVACGQFEPLPGSLARNTETIRSLAREAAQRGAGILVLPELCLCGYLGTGEAAASAVAEDGPEIGAVAACARDNRLALAFGFAERTASGVLSNSMALLDAAGKLRGVYRKVHLWVTEKEWAVPGAGFETSDLTGLCVGMWICYDSRFPEAARALATRGATLGLVGSAWFGPAEEWELAIRSRAMDNGIFVAGASLLGSFGSAAFHGESLIVDPHGTVVARAEPNRTQLITAEYDSAQVDAFRARLPLLSDMRPDAYA